MQPKFPQRGFTLLEILISVAVVGILVAIAYPLYRDYQARARASDIVVKYDAVRAGIGAELAQGSVESCTDLASRANPDNLRDPYARLAIGFEKESDGYRAVFAVCAEASQQGTLGVAVAREAHGVFTKTNRIEQGAVLTDSLASFAVPLSAGAITVCKKAPANPVVQCGVAQAAGPAVQVPSQPAQQPSRPSAPDPVTCAPGSEAVLIPGKANDSGADQYGCFKVCAPGQTRDSSFRCVDAQPPTRTPQQACQDQGSLWVNGQCKTPQQLCQEQGSQWVNGQCKTPQQLCQEQGSQWVNGRCTQPARTSCPPGYRPNPQGHCVPDHRK